MAKKEKDALVGLAYIKKATSENPRAPKLRGFVSITPELAKVLSNLEPDSYGTVKLEIALWTVEDQPGVLKGTAQLPYDVRQGKVNPQQASQAVANDEDIPF